MRYDKVEQLINLAFLMQSTAEGVSLQDIRGQFGVSRRTAERMRDAVGRVFADVEEVHFNDDRFKRWRLKPNSLSRLAYVGADDIADVQLAIDTFNNDGMVVQASRLQSLLIKLKATMGADKQTRMETDLQVLLEAQGYATRPGPTPHINTHIIHTLRDSILTNTKLHMVYTHRYTGDDSERVIHPYGLLYGNRHHLVAWCERAGAMRIFTLGNIRTLDTIDAYFERDADFDLTTYTQRSFGIWQEHPFKVRWKFHSDVAKDAKNHHFHPTQTFEQQPDGSVIVTFTAGGAIEMCRHLFTWETSVEILEPEWLKQEYVQKLQDILENLQ